MVYSLGPTSQSSAKIASPARTRATSTLQQTNQIRFAGDGTTKPAEASSNSLKKKLTQLWRGLRKKP